MAQIGDPNMYFNDSKLQQIDDELQNTVFGFTRNQQKLSSNPLFNNIPRNVNLTILAFYVGLSDEFDPNLCGKNIKLSNNNKKIIGGTGWNTCYGKKVISSIINGTYIWKLKNLSTNLGGIFIGIANETAIDTNFAATDSEPAYAYSPFNGTYWVWPDNKFKLSDIPRMKFYGEIITMKLEINSNDSILSFKLNDDKKEFKINNIIKEKGINYRLAVSICTKKQSLEII